MAPRRRCAHEFRRTRLGSQARRGLVKAMPRTGRRPGAGGTGEKILAAARAHFARPGYDAGTVRGIAAEAAGDPALVLHYFGPTAGVFRGAVACRVEPS